MGAAANGLRAAAVSLAEEARALQSAWDGMEASASGSATRRLAGEAVQPYLAALRRAGDELSASSSRISDVERHLER